VTICGGCGGSGGAAGKGKGKGITPDKDSDSVSVELSRSFVWFNSELLLLVVGFMVRGLSVVDSELEVCEGVRCICTPKETYGHSYTFQEFII